MKTVYAHHDNGPMTLLTRWKPWRVFCTDEPGASHDAAVEHVVKFRQGQVGTAALVSEVVGGFLLEAGNVPTLDRRLVSVDRSFADSCRSQGKVPYPVEEGLHFGTVYRADVQAGPPTRFEGLDAPQELIDLWAFDSWLCTTDRGLYGNTLLVWAAGDRYHLLAADQSDCFGGAGSLADGHWSARLQKVAPAESLPMLDQALLAAGAGALRDALAKVRQAAARLPEALAEVPAAWWPQAGVRADQLQPALQARAGRLEEIVDLPKWEGLSDAAQGGVLL